MLLPGWEVPAGPPPAALLQGEAPPAALIVAEAARREAKEISTRVLTAEAVPAARTAVQRSEMSSVVRFPRRASSTRPGGQEGRL
ncbi:MAG TPA: hypothetical protein VJT33_16160 [bacterium]|nr:hypothetical protein [bacterium]